MRTPCEIVRGWFRSSLSNSTNKILNRRNAGSIDRNNTKVSACQDCEGGFENSNQAAQRIPNGETEGRGRQYYASFTVCLAALTAGLGSGWASPMLLLLKSDDSPVGKMSLKEMSNLETIPVCFSLVGIFVFGSMIDKLGRKIVGYATSLLAILGWLCLLLAINPYYLYVGRAFTGMSQSGGMMVGAVYISEVVHESRRGGQMSLFMFAGQIGTLLGYILGDAMSYHWFNSMCLIAPILFPLCWLRLPETPYFLSSKSRTGEARDSLVWFRGGNEIVADRELQSIKTLQRTDKSFREVIKARGTRKALCIIAFLFVFQQINGSSISQGYASVIFEDSGTTIRPNSAATILTAIKVGATYASVLLVDRLGRRLLLIVTYIVLAICMMMISVFFYEKEFGGMDVGQYSWVPLVSLSSFNIAFSLGIGTLAEVVGNEVIPPDIKGVSSIICGTLTIMSLFGVLQAYPYIHDHVGAYANFAYPSVFNLLGSVLTYYLVPETKGKSLEDIMAFLDRPT